MKPIPLLQTRQLKTRLFRLSRQQWDALWQAVYVVADAVTVTGAFALAYYVRFQSGWFATVKGVPPLSAHVNFLIFLLITWFFVFRWCGLYQPRRGWSCLDEYYTVLVGTAVASLMLLGAVSLSQAHWFSRLFLALAAGGSAVAVCLERSLLRRGQRALLRRGVGVRRAALIARSNEMEQMVRRLAQPALGYQIVGVIQGNADGSESRASRLADSNAPTHQPTNLSTPFPCLGTSQDLSALIERHALDEVIAASNALRQEEVLKVSEVCARYGVAFKLMPSLLDVIKRRALWEEVAGLPLITISSSPLTPWDCAVKRTFDVVVSALLLLLLAPMMAIIALLIRLTSRGPVLFKQERVGQDGKVFICYKFRTMREDAEAQTGPVWTTENDPRRTRLGAFLRRTSLDELPQLFNILKGDMSLVGPRPERPFFVEQFTQTVPRYAERHKVKAGLTGWAQVNGLRGNTPIAERTLYDLYYLENWSLALDLKILIKTACEVLFHRTAY
ncbi:MAG: undecaprenyl-phosphate glucose phosphotransferase [Abditibacteriales bacterium]|nr:undecaprenyl-phosphate glucose phosphotransferase [Abditibacteriales bacterium]MDW8367768.1 undecaprenyl-phosphate glucose phosphotransferase [Abditibacteriales bacterium]